MKEASKKHILFTRSISAEHANYGEKLGLQVSSKAFISINLNKLTGEQIQQINSKTEATWIFTSQNAVRCIASHLDQISNKNIACYAVGQKTAEVLKQHGIDAKTPETHNARALVDLLENDKQKSFIYFTGNLRQNTLVDYFTENELEYSEVECYQTVFEKPKVRLENFNAICFCSPSAVVSFFNQYQLNENIPAIAIGSTTAVKLLDYTEHVVMAESANIFAMLDISNEYLNF